MKPTPDLVSWLNAATRGLPAAIKRVVRDELTAHYDDLVSDFQLEGITAAEAEQQALLSLGDAQTTAIELRRAHFSQPRNRQAALVSMVSLLTFVFGALFTIPPVLFMLVGVGCTAYTLYALGRLRGLAGEVHRRANALIVIGTLVTVAVGTFGQPNTPTVYVLSDPFIITRFDLYWQPILLFHWLLAAAVIGVGIGWLWLGETLYGQDKALHGLAFPLRLCMVGVGLGLLGAGGALLVRNALMLNLANLLIVICGTARQALLVFIFFRAARRPSTPLALGV